MDDFNFENSSFATSEYRSPQMEKLNSRSPKKFIILFLILIVLVGGAYFVSSIFGGKSGQEKKTETTITPSPTEYQFPTDTPAPSVSPSPETSPTPSTKPTSNPIDKASGLDRSSLNVEIQNGSGVVGAGSKASDFLKSLGYHVAAVGNAGNFNYENVTIQIKSTSSKFLNLLKSDLGGQYTVGSTSEDLSASSSADAVVIIGK